MIEKLIVIVGVSAALLLALAVAIKIATEIVDGFGC